MAINYRTMSAADIVATASRIASGAERQIATDPSSGVASGEFKLNYDALYRLYSEYWLSYEQLQAAIKAVQDAYPQDQCVANPGGNIRGVSMMESLCGQASKLIIGRLTNASNELVVLMNGLNATVTNMGTAEQDSKDNFDRAALPPGD